MTSGKSELAIFDRALPQIICAQGNYYDIYPVENITGKSVSVINFIINTSNNEYIDLNDTLLYISVKAVKHDLSDFAANDDIFAKNFTFHTLFNDVILSLNGVEVEGGNGTYQWSALIENNLNFSSDTKTTQLGSIGYAKVPADRQVWIAQSKIFDMCGSLRLGMFSQPKYLIPGIIIKLKLILNRGSFQFHCKGAQAADTPIFLMQSAKLVVRKVKVNPAVQMGHELGLKKQNAYYPLQKSIVRSYAIPAGSLSYNKDVIFSTYKLPNFLIIAFVKHDVYNGNYKEDTLFKNADVDTLELRCGSDYIETYNQNFDTGIGVVESYTKSLIRNFENLERNTNLGIDYGEFKETHTFFTFNLSPDLNFSTHQLPKDGNLRLRVKFSKALPTAYNILLYGKFDSEIQITKDYVVINDFK